MLATILSVSSSWNRTQPISHQLVSNPIFSTLLFWSRCRLNRGGNRLVTRSEKSKSWIELKLIIFRYLKKKISVVTRDEVGAYKPYLWEQSTFYNGVLFREWILTKIVNGERASYSAPKFARMQERTRSQMLEDIVANLQNHAETGQIPKPYRSAGFKF